MTSSHSKARNASSSLGLSAAASRLAADKKREFDLRVLELTRDFEDLKSGDSDGVALADVKRFFRENRLADNGRAEELFLEFQSCGASRSANLIDKSQYIKKSLQVEDQITAKINDKVSAVSALKQKFENSVKKLEEAKVLSRLK